MLSWLVCGLVLGELISGLDLLFYRRRRICRAIHQYVTTVCAAPVRPAEPLPVGAGVWYEVQAHALGLVRLTRIDIAQIRADGRHSADCDTGTLDAPTYFISTSGIGVRVLWPARVFEVAGGRPFYAKVSGAGGRYRRVRSRELRQLTRELLPALARGLPSR